MTFDLYDVLGIMSMGLIKVPPKEKEEPILYIPKEIPPMKCSFRPRILEEYIGQSNAKELIRLNIEKIKTIKPVHFIINGTRGHGKSTLAYIIAKELDFKIHTYIGGSFSMTNLNDFLLENQAGGYHILFIDEIHGLIKEIAEFMYPIIEDFEYPINNDKLRKFIMIGATTDKNILLKKFGPLVDRCGAQINLEHYQPEDIKKILKQYNAQTHKMDIDDSIYDILSVNTRFNPRTSLALFDDYVVCRDINKVLRAHRVVKDSLTTDDMIILKHLSDVGEPVGVETLAIITQQTKEDYISLIEPFLLQHGYMSRTSRGRVVTTKGKDLVRSING